MRIFALFALPMLVFSSCFTQKSTTSTKAVEEISVGGQRDEHGCLVAAGQTWSKLQKKCLQIFNEGLRLNPLKPQGSAVLSAFVLYNEDKTKIELFLPTEKETIILDELLEGSYRKDIYWFDAATETLYINKEASFKAEE